MKASDLLDLGSHMTEKPPQQGAVREVKKLEKIIDKLRRVELQEFTNYLHSPWRIFLANFLAGTARGLGFLIGVSVVLAAMGFILSKVLSQIPLVGDFFQIANIWIQETVEKIGTK